MDGLKIQWLATAQEDLRVIRTYYMDNAGKIVMHNRIKKIMDSVSLYNYSIGANGNSVSFR